MYMTTSTRQVGGVTIVDISGRIVLGEESAALRDLVCDLLSKGHKKILLILAMSITSTAQAWAIWSVLSRACGSRREN